MINHLLEYLGKKTWLVVLGLLILLVGVFCLNIYYPLTFKMSYCVIKDEQYSLHDTTYRMSTVLQKEGGATVRLCIKESTRTLRTNLVEK